MKNIHIETPRLKIRPFAMEDHDALWEIFGDPAVMEHVAPYTEEETREFLRTFCVEREVPGGFAVVRKDGGRLIGYLLCNQIDEPGIYELGWIFHRSFWRQGYATEMVGGMIGHAKSRGAKKITVFIFSENPGSNAIARKFGFRLAETLVKKKRGTDREIIDYKYELDL